jgi:Protein of unknown function DUF88.
MFITVLILMKYGKTLLLPFLIFVSEKSKEEKEKDKAEPIGVFWDIENCQVPRGISALAIVQKIRKTFYPGRREVDFMCVCDTTKEKKEVLEELNRAQVIIN